MATVAVKSRSTPSTDSDTPKRASTSRADASVPPSRPRNSSSCAAARASSAALEAISRSERNGTGSAPGTRSARRGRLRRSASMAAASSGNTSSVSSSRASGSLHQPSARYFSVRVSEKPTWKMRSSRVSRTSSAACAGSPPVRCSSPSDR